VLKLIIEIENSSHLVMLGTPNIGSPCADLMYPTYKSLGFEVEGLRQLDRRSSPNLTVRRQIAKA
jgi:hypothetical protein